VGEVRFSARVSLGAAVTLLFSAVVTAQNSVSTPKLKGITQVSVWVEFQEGGGMGACAETSIAKTFGILEDQVRTETELQLRKSGIQVAGGAIAVLHVMVNGCGAMLPYTNAPLMNIQVTLEEWAVTDRKQRGVVVTWRTWSSRINPANPRTDIQDLVSEFVNQWLADNEPAQPRSAAATQRKP